MENLGQRLLIVLVLVGSMTLLWWWVLPDAEPAAIAESGWLVTEVIDGDTIVAQRRGIEERVRFIGIDTPERGECGYQEASQFLLDIIWGQEVTLVTGATTDRDAYDRLLRYVEYGGLDVGLGQISEGHAVARYDSRTGQPHPREELYREADAGTVHICDR